MAKVNLSGSVEDEFVKMALERGWMINKEALTSQQESIIKSVMNLRKVDYPTALEYAKIRYPAVFRQPEPKPNMYKEWAEGMPGLEEPVEVDWNKLTEEAKGKMQQEKAVPTIQQKWQTGAKPGEIVDTELPTISGPEEVETGKMPEVKLPEWAKADDMAVVSSVISELISLADDLDEMGETKVALAVDKQTKIYKEAIDKFYDITGETGEDLINQAHPGGGPTLVPAAEEGGKVETIVEEQKKSIEKATKTPTGKYAEVINKLVATANKLEDEGDIEAAKIVDKTINKLYRAVRPFPNRSSVFEATGSEDKKASVRKEAKYDEFIPKWDRLIEDLWTKIYDAIVGKWFKSFTTYFSPAAQQQATFVQSRYKTSAGVIEDIGGAWHKLSLSQLSNKIKSLADLLNFGDKTFDLFNTLFVSEKNANAMEEKHKKLVSGLYSLSKEMYGSIKEPKEKEPVKKDKFKGKETSYLRRDWRNKYFNLLNKLEQLYRQNSVPIAETLPGGTTEALKLEKWIKERKYNVSQRKPGEEHYFQPGVEDIKGLSQWINSLKQLLRKASLTGLIKQAQPPGAPPIALPGVKRTPRKAPRTQGNRAIIELQQALKNAGFDLGKYGVDGRWGKDTAAAYNKMLESIQQYLGRTFGLSPKGAKDTPSTSEISIAKRIANFIAKKTGGAGQVEFKIEGKTFDLGDLRSPQAFIQALERNNLISAEEHHTDEPETLALDAKKYLRQLAIDLRGDLANILAIKYGPQVVDTMFEQVKTLWSAFSNLKFSPTKKMKTDKTQPGMMGREKMDLSQLKTKGGLTLNNIYNQALSLQNFKKTIDDAEEFRGAAEAKNMTEQEFLVWLNKQRHTLLQELRTMNRQELIATKKLQTWNALANYLDSFGEWLEAMRRELNLSYRMPKPTPKPTPKPVPTQTPTKTSHEAERSSQSRYVFTESTGSGDIFWDRVNRNYVFKQPDGTYVPLTR